MYRDSYQVHNMNDEVYDMKSIPLYQFMGHGLTEHDTYPKALKYLCDSRNVYIYIFFSLRDSQNVYCPSFI